MRLYHETPRENVASILSEGFRDGGPFRQPAGDLYGVCVADEPPGFRSDWALLAIDAKLTVDELEPFAYNRRAWRPHGNHYLEWCVPAKSLNECGRPTLIK